jgi:hypothetical protein
MTNVKLHAGYAVQLAGLVALAVGAVLSAHHLAIGASLLGGAAALHVGKIIRTVTF